MNLNGATLSRRYPMAEYSLFNLALQVENMRNAQKLYFEKIKKAKATKLPSVDDSLKDIMSTGKEVPNA